MSRRTESDLKQKWIRTVARPRGLWVQSLAASVFGSGLADMLVGQPREVEIEAGGETTWEPTLRFVEAKRTLGLDRRPAFVPGQLTASQRAFLDAVTKHGGSAFVLLLDEAGWWEIPWEQARLGVVSKGEFKAAMTPWGGGR